MADKLTELFDQLYRDNQAMVYKLALGLTGNAHDADAVRTRDEICAFIKTHVGK